MTHRAAQALAEAQVVAGYKTYLKRVEGLLAGKRIVASGMTAELDRAAQAIDLALDGQIVAIVSGGDSGVYGMSAVVYELLARRGLAVGPGGLALEVVPGVPAVAAAGALLGAPLSHDFACVSLSDRLTAWEVIQRRLDAAAGADFVIALYNPKSHGRHWQYAQALEIIGRHRAADTPVGLVRAAMQDEQSVGLCRLDQAADAPVDMQTIVIIGNSNSFVHLGKMVTPRGYLAKYGDKTAEGDAA